MPMTDYLQTALLALIQGVTELLPVSSSAHVILAQRMMGRDPSDPRETFLLVMLHTGTMGAVLVYFWPRWRRLVVPSAAPPRPGEAKTPASRFLLLVVAATVCTGAVGLGLLFLIERVVLERMLGSAKGEVEQLFRNLWLVGAALFAVGLVILAAAWVEGRAKSPVLSLSAAVLIGLVQGLCLPFRGFSRSGATISTGLFCGVSRTLAEDFSFALAVVLTPVVIGRSVLRLLGDEKVRADPGQLLGAVGPGLVGMVLSFIAGFLALFLLSAALEKGRWKFFGWYCLAASLVVFGAAGAGF
jgi:undecaprenyl-diphosphatase